MTDLHSAESVSEYTELVRAYEALVVMPDPPTYQLWTLAEKALNLARYAEAEVERLKGPLHHLMAFGERLMASDDENERGIGCCICEGARVVRDA